MCVRDRRRFEKEKQGKVNTRRKDELKRIKHITNIAKSQTLPTHTIGQRNKKRTLTIRTERLRGVRRQNNKNAITTRR